MILLHFLSWSEFVYKPLERSISCQMLVIWILRFTECLFRVSLGWIDWVFFFFFLFCYQVIIVASNWTLLSLVCSSWLLRKLSDILLVFQLVKATARYQFSEFVSQILTVPYCCKNRKKAKTFTWQYTILVLQKEQERNFDKIFLNKDFVKQFKFFFFFLTSLKPLSTQLFKCFHHFFILKTNKATPTIFHNGLRKKIK